MSSLKKVLNEIEKEAFGKGWLLTCLCNSHRPSSLKGIRIAPSEVKEFVICRGEVTPKGCSFVTRGRMAVL